MTAEYCRGCGSVLQSADPEGPGFIPETVRGKNSICQRCYQMIHYGKSGKVRLNPEQIEQKVFEAIRLSQTLVIVADFSDLTGTLPVWSGMVAGRTYLIAVNKIDLAPKRTPKTELLDYLKKYVADRFQQQPAALVLTSGVKGYGVTTLLSEIKKATPAGARIGLLGMTNVGKSSLIKQITAAGNSKRQPTVSKFPGTTLGLSNWDILKGRNTLIDTPGLAPGDRLGDLLCPECAGRLVSAAGLSHKLWGIKPGKGIIIDRYLGIANAGDSEAVLLSFVPGRLEFHRTAGVKISDYLAKGPPWLVKDCPQCSPKLSWQEEQIRLKPNTDLAIAGLGWVSARVSETEFKLWYPKGVRLEIRPALIGKRDQT
ncbi:MAG: hypothetical protein GX075_05065 [Firmicutes bacterium]|nr:hypothetical protein [Bacillota bacterium]